MKEYHNNVVSRIDSDSINRLCASQVILDLKGCVKELIDNALDANATTIKILIVDDGIALVEVNDNGTGIQFEDLKSICIRYSTSKIQKFEDIQASLKSIGFRGEALNSLCAISDLSITSRTLHDDFGTRIQFNSDGTKNHIQQPFPCTVGTTVSARNLFHNFPVRQREFVRNTKSQVTHLVNLVTSYALIHSNIKYTLLSQLSTGRDSGQILSLLSSNGIEKTLLESVGSLLGVAQCKDLVPFNLTPTDQNGTQSNHAWRLSGLLLPPASCYRKQRRLQFLYVNKRPIENYNGMKLIINQLSNAYKILTSGQSSPQYVLCLDTVDDFIDFNLTPDKMSVFIKDEQLIANVLYDYIMKIFGSQIASLSQQSSLDMHFPLQSSTPDSINSDQSESCSQQSTNTNEILLGKNQKKRSRSTMCGDDEPDSNFTAIGTYRGTAMAEFGTVYMSKRSRMEFDNLNPETSCLSSIPSSQSVLRYRITTLTPKAAQCGKIIGEVKQEKGAQENDETLNNQICLSSVQVTSDQVTTADVQQAQTHQVTSNGSSETNREKHFSIYEWKLASLSNSKSNMVGLNSVLLSEGKLNNTVSMLAESKKHVPSRPFLKKSRFFVPSQSDSLMPFNQCFSSVEFSSPPLDYWNSTLSLRASAANCSAQSTTQTKPFSVKRKRMAGILDSWNSKTGESPLKYSRKTKDHHECNDDDDLITIQGLNFEDQLGLGPEQINIDNNEKYHHRSESMFQFPKSLFIKIRIIGQFNLGFIIGSLYIDSTKQELFIIDQHATDEKARFEYLCKSKKIQPQRLVVPMKLSLTPTERQIVLNHLPIFQMNGFLITVNDKDHTVGDDTDDKKINDLIGSQTFQLEGLPMLHKNTFSIDDLRDLIEIVSENNNTESSSSDSINSSLQSLQSILRPPRIRSTFASWACRSAIMIGQSLNISTMKSIIERMAELDHPWNCPHGRPTMRHLCSNYSYSSNLKFK